MSDTLSVIAFVLATVSGLGVQRNDPLEASIVADIHYTTAWRILIRLTKQGLIRLVRKHEKGQMAYDYRLTGFEPASP
ncbi:MAG: hypothetical protein EXS23_05770 [Pedosphaera sp.]|nr:hypothetical protein [Pedosphaera sp.]